MMSGSRLLLAALLLAARAGAQAHPEIVVGVDGTGRLVARYDREQPYPLAASRFPGIDGYADAFPGLSSIFEPRPGEDLRPADPASRLEFVLLAVDEGLVLWNDTGTGTLAVGESFGLGHPPFDAHPLWILPKGEAGRRYTLTLELRDTTGRHAESEPFTPAFTPDDTAMLFTCPMACGGGNTFAAPGTCPVCDMRLKLVSARSHRVVVTPLEGEGEPVLRAGEEARLRFELQSPDGVPVQDLEIVHEKLLHLLIVSDDLSWFAHEHPEQQPDGSFHLPLTFPHGGGFTLYHDFTPRAVGMQVVAVPLEVEGAPRPAVPLEPDAAQARQVDGFTVSLGAPRALRALVNQRLAFRIERDGQPVTDLQPFLGALGHLIVVSEDRSRFVHSHPLPPPALPGLAAAPAAGPEVVFHALFPAPGRYKAWGQFQHDGRVITAPFVFDVVAP